MARSGALLAALVFGGAACGFPDVSYRVGEGGAGGAGATNDVGGGGSAQGGGGNGASTSTNTSTNTSTSTQTGVGGGPTCTDRDGDQYVAESDNGACSPPEFLGYGDCDDGNDDVHPNQATYFTMPRSGFPVTDEAAWNYDCNDSLDLLYEVGCQAGLTPKDGLAVSAGVSGCGDTGPWRVGGTVSCMDDPDRTQGCR